MINSKTEYFIGLPTRHRENYILTLTEEEQLRLLEDIYTLINIELSKILEYLNNINNK